MNFLLCYLLGLIGWWTDGRTNRGIAINPVNHEIYVTNAGDSSVSVYGDITGSSTFNRDTSAKFVPPNGQTIPKGVAIVFLTKRGRFF